MAKKARVRVFDSPIETMMRNGLCQGALRHGFELYDFSTSERPAVAEIDDGDFCVRDAGHWAAWQLQDCAPLWRIDKRLWHWRPATLTDGTTLRLFGNVSWRSYKLDLLLEVQDRYIAIECDGHDWHDRTKQQAAYDRARDRELAAVGVIALRCTGSEIHHSIERCVDDVFAVVRRVLLEEYRTAEVCRQLRNAVHAADMREAV